MKTDGPQIFKNSLDPSQSSSSSQQESPLWMVTKEPSISYLVNYLSEMRHQILSEPNTDHHLSFSRSQLVEVRQNFSSIICKGEEKLHKLCEILCKKLELNSYTLNSVVVGSLGDGKDTFSLSQKISKEQLYSHTDLDLGTRQLKRLAFCQDSAWYSPELIANYVEYLPFEINQYEIHKVISRIKAEEEIWNKVADEIFDIDHVIIRDKKLNPFSKYVKDVFGIKIVSSSKDSCLRLHDMISNLTLSAELFEHLDIPMDQANRSFEVVEVKDYLTKKQEKLSGWNAIKSVIRWGGGTFEIQIQPLQSYYLECDHLTKESHQAFKTKRDKLRHHIGELIPLYRFYRDLLRWLFLNPDGPAPQLDRVKVLLSH